MSEFIEDELRKKNPRFGAARLFSEDTERQLRAYRRVTPLGIEMIIRDEDVPVEAPIRPKGWQWLQGSGLKSRCHVLRYFAARWTLSIHWHGIVRLRRASLHFKSKREVDLIPRWMCAKS